jgi:ABC-type multidrug transport system ATPase subunit
LDILAKKHKLGDVGGSIKINDTESIEPRIYAKLIGYVDQEDIHLADLTVREVLDFSAALRLPESMSKEQKRNRVDEILKQLGISHIADSKVGGLSRRGISGGEKRRLSIGVELVTNPSVLFLDEPTSGLDSNTALQVITVLSNLAKDTSKTVIISLTLDYNYYSSA